MDVEVTKSDNRYSGWETEEWQDVAYDHFKGWYGAVQPDGTGFKELFFVLCLFVFMEGKREIVCKWQ